MPNLILSVLLLLAHPDLRFICFSSAASDNLSLSLSPSTHPRETGEESKGKDGGLATTHTVAHIFPWFVGCHFSGHHSMQRTWGGSDVVWTISSRELPLTVSLSLGHQTVMPPVKKVRPQDPHPTHTRLVSRGVCPPGFSILPP